MKKLIVALDINNENDALNLVDKLGENVDLYKVGPILFLKTGPSIIRKLKEKGKEVFLDLKFHDIPKTVQRSVESAADLGVYSLTLHSSGGEDMLKAAAQVSKRPKLWAVSVLTSAVASGEDVMRRVVIARKNGVDGVISSALEAQTIKKACGRDFEVITPGIRLEKTNDDQKRVATPSFAVKAGADFIVVGRPIIQAEDPHFVAKKINEEIDGL
jgi:orotidine-5'-phosphate decarboxylase